MNLRHTKKWCHFWATLYIIASKNVAIAKKADRAVHDVWYSCSTEPLT